MKLYKANQSVTPTRTHLDKILVGKVKLVEQLWPYFIRGGGGINPICTTHTQPSVRNEESISINRVTYNSGIQFLANLFQLIVNIVQDFHYQPIYYLGTVVHP
jgi:hypothetical protein